MRSQTLCEIINRKKNQIRSRYTTTSNREIKKNELRIGNVKAYRSNEIQPRETIGRNNSKLNRSYNGQRTE